MIYKEHKQDTYNIYTIKTNKFKTCHIEIVFRNNINKDEITKRSVLIEMLVENTKKYNTRRKFAKQLEELYNSNFYGIMNRVGNSILTSFCFDFINPKLVKEDVKDFIKFPIEAILHPNINNEEFDIETFNYIIERVKKDIKSIVENPKAYSINKLLENMCPNTPSSICISGYLDDLNNITNVNLCEYYKNMIQHDYIDIYIIGDLDMQNVVNIIKETTNINVLKDHKITYEVNNKTTNKIKKISLPFDITQDNICFGLNITNMSNYEKNYIANLYNMILGGGSLETKLYSNLRNKNSLCYNCVSIYQKFDSLLIIHTAVDKENEDKAIKLIKKSLNDMSNGKITEKELSNAKKLIITNLNMILDNPNRIVDNYIFKNIYGLDDIEKRINNYNNVTLKEVNNFAKKLKINTILSMKEVNNERN